MRAAGTEYALQSAEQKVREDLEAKDHIRRGILSYLVEHPDAQDTLEGIAEWWLLQMEINRNARLIREALSEMTEMGFLIQWQEKDLQTHYRIAANKLEEISDFLTRGKLG